MKMLENNSLFIIIGSSRGLGKALAKYVSGHGNNDLIVVNRRKVKQNKGNCREVIIDLSKPVSPTNLKRLFTAFKGKYYKKVYLINNASSICPIKPLGKIRQVDFGPAITVNFLNYAIIINEFIKQFRSLRADKKILNLTSGAASSPHYGLATYCSTKAALEMFSECVFIEQERLRQIKIMALRPGVINTQMQKQMRECSPADFIKSDLYMQLYKNNKLRAPEEVATQIYKILIDDKYWGKPILDINHVNE